MALSPTKKKTTAKKGDKRLKMDNTKFRSLQHFKRYTQFYIKATIIQERFVDLVDLKDTFIPSRVVVFLEILVLMIQEIHRF